MPRNIARSERMDDKIVVRCHSKDKAELTVAAQQMGMDCSAFVRYILIKEKVLSPV